MDKTTFSALERLIEEVKEKRKAKCLNIDCVVNHRIGGNDIDLVENWIKGKKQYVCPACNITRVNPFPVSDETGDTYCPDCNATLKLKTERKTQIVELNEHTDKLQKSADDLYSILQNKLSGEDMETVDELIETEIEIERYCNK